MRRQGRHPIVEADTSVTDSRSALHVVEGIDLSGKVCVVTGASSGLGRESARALAAAGAQVILAARNSEALAEAARWIAAEVPDAQTSTMHLDLTSLASVRAAATEITELTPVIHVLMNNAGVMFTPFGRTQDGFEMQIETNHFGHFELTRLLTPQLAAAQGARLVILSSGGHALGDVDLGDPNWERREYDKFVAYGASKTANILHAREADRRLQELGIRAFAVHPGTVATSLARYMSRSDFSQLREFAAANSAGRGESSDGYLDFTTPDYGAATQVWAAVSPELADQGGLYLEDCGFSETVAPYACDAEHAADLWALSEKLCAAS
jgi:NAD(P)-dependent dehydrogenase (short-subunit alcohol dehydrogenase family)